MKANRASALVPISRSTESAVPARSSGQKHHAEHGALGRVHRGFLQLGRHHFAEALEAADIDLCARSIVLHRFA
jgi:hypothetical protein